LDIDFSNLHEAALTTKTAIEEGEKCNIKGKVMLQRVTGQMAISFN